MAALPPRRGAAGKVLRREVNYFAEHAGRMNYQALDRRGWPIASGTAELAWRSRQRRRKRSGLRQVDALEEARDHGYWDELWLAA